jgi:hypothetical protein
MHDALKKLLQQEIDSLESLLWLTPLLGRQLAAFRDARSAIEAGELDTPEPPMEGNTCNGCGLRASYCECDGQHAPDESEATNPSNGWAPPAPEGR